MICLYFDTISKGTKIRSLLRCSELRWRIALRGSTIRVVVIPIHSEMIDISAIKEEGDKEA